MMREVFLRGVRWPAAAFLANFAVGKGLAFVGPIFLGLVLAPEVFGTLDYALATAGFLIGFLTLGIPQASMQLLVMRQGRVVADLLSGIAALIGTISTLAALALALAQIAPQWSMVLALLALSASQQCGSAFARARGWRNVIVWADHSHIVLIVLVTVAIWLSKPTVSLTALQAALTALAAASSLASLVIFIQTRGPSLPPRMLEAIKIGAPMLVAGLCQGWILTSGRIFIEQFLNKPDLYAYSFSFRVAGLLILLHAVIVTAFPARLYKMPTRRFDQIACILVLGLGMAALLFILLPPQIFIAQYFSPGNAAVLLQRPGIAFVPAQVFFWGAGAIIEMRLSRARRAGTVVPRILALAAFTAATVFALVHYGTLSFNVLLLILVLQQAGSCVAMHAVLIRRRVPLRKTGWLTLAMGFCVMTAAAAKIYWI